MPPTTSYSCPFCGEEKEAEPALRFHLIGKHKKSELADHVIESSNALDQQTLPL